MSAEQPDWEWLLCEVCRRYPRYGLNECGDLSFPQIDALLRQTHKRPYEYVAMVEPRK